MFSATFDVLIKISKGYQRQNPTDIWVESVTNIISMDVDRYRNIYEGFSKNFTYPMSIK